jgi:hypothetical protein
MALYYKTLKELKKIPNASTSIASLDGSSYVVVRIAGKPKCVAILASSLGHPYDNNLVVLATPDSLAEEDKQFSLDIATKTVD